MGPNGTDKEPTTPPLRLAQRRLAVRTFFEFGDEQLRFGHDDGSVAQTHSVDYAELAMEHESRFERPLPWLVLGLVGCAMAVARLGMDFAAGQGPTLSGWWVFGLAALALHLTGRCRYTVIPGPRAAVFVLRGRGHDAILAEIERRRVAQLRERFDYLTPDEPAEQQRHRVLWLQRQGSLDDHEVSARLLQIELMVQAHPGAPRDADED